MKKIISNIIQSRIYEKNILKLKSLVLVKFTKDQMVVPIESQVYLNLY